MIQNKQDLAFYIAADRIMNGYPAKCSLLSKIKETKVIGGGKTIIMNYLSHLRRYAYYYNAHKRTFSWNSVMMAYEHYKVAKLGIKCGFSIGHNSIGYGVVIPHYGTIVVNDNARIGNFAVLHTCTCIAGGNKVIGDGLYLSTGSQIVGSLKLGDGVTVAAHSLVNKSFDNNILLAGAPCVVKNGNYSVWYVRDGEEYINRVELVNQVRKEIYK